MPPFFTPTTIVYKILFFLKRFLVTAADNVPPHKLSSLSYPPPPPLQSVKQDLWQSAPRANLCFLGTGGGLARVCLPLPHVNRSILTDMDGEEGWGEEGRGGASVETRTGEKGEGYRTNVRVSGGLLGPRLWKMLPLRGVF